MPTNTIPVHLDPETLALVNDTVRSLIEMAPDAILAVILFGSVARHEERPLSDPAPSDVDILAIIDTNEKHLHPYRQELFGAIGRAVDAHLTAPRDVNVLFATRTMWECDEMFLENVAHDGIILYQRTMLPPSVAAFLAPMQTRVQRQEVA
jgi:predicted nucleotidyltransferase